MAEPISLSVKPATGFDRNFQRAEGWAVFGANPDKPMTFVFSTETEADISLKRLLAIFALPDNDSPETNALYRTAFRR